ncbi:MAG TPA: hypothetical protein VFE55_11540 [Acidimicrobiia bacterium]|nr:hypothetical protein [Acidimicrobiia bacterium]
MTRLLRSRPALAPAVALLLTLAPAACGKDGSGGSTPKAAARPTTAARVQILEPTPNQETGPDVTVKVQLIGAKEVPQSGPPIKPDEGHIHVSLDGQIVAMAYGDSQTLKGLQPGQHSVQVDFVAADHIPFANRVTAAVLFTVK